LGRKKVSSGLLEEKLSKFSTNKESQMTISISPQTKRNSKPHGHRKSKKQLSLHKPNGVIAPRVKKVGADHFAFVCVDPAKERSEWMMADYYGNLLIEPTTVEHQAAQLNMAVVRVQQAKITHHIEDMIVTVERTGNYHLPVQRAFKKAGFEVRIVHPFATKQFRQPADPGNKTDQTDLFAQHRAAVAGFGLCEPPLDPLYHELQLRIRHRRDLVEKSTALTCQIREHLNLAMPRYAVLFTDLLGNALAMKVASETGSPQSVIDLGMNGMITMLRTNNVRFQNRAVEKILAWARQAVQLESLDGARLHHAIWTDLYQLYENLQSKISELEQQIAGDLAATPYIRLLVIPGINVVSAADLAGEMGPIGNYANANAITGRCGLYPSRYQSDQTDNAGSIIRSTNRRLRGAIMRVADNLAKSNAFFRARAAVDESNNVDKRAARVRIAKTFSRLVIACVAGDSPLKHPCCTNRFSVIDKLRSFHYEHGTALDQALADLQSAVGQLPAKTCEMEAQAVSVILETQANSKRGPKKLGELLPSILAKLDAQAAHQTQGPTVSD
jgi:transposase